jgi:tagaturonate epimerase
MTSAFPTNLSVLRERANLARDYPHSFVALDDAALWLEGDGVNKQLAVLALPTSPVLARFTGTQQPSIDQYVVLRCPADVANARALRETLTWLRPVPLGLTTSAGCGDRLGLATPGHVRALQQVLAGASNRTIAPIFAQQSIREMDRTGRGPVDVLTDATWGAFQSGWRSPVGADADHLKTPEDIDVTVAAGFSFFTIDPGTYVDNEADEAPVAAVRRKVDGLPWAELESGSGGLRGYVGQRVALEDREISLDEEAVMRAAAKYGAAIAHVARMYRHLAGKGVPFELEISVDETETPTTHQEHIFFVHELRRLGVQWVSLAPRYTGRFEKGVDYIGDLDTLRADLAGHAAIARVLGPYKLSLHSGSDKFSVYPIIAEVAGGLVHLKTAGTSYLEALRVVARLDPAFFREILGFARAHYVEDRVSYHVSAELSKVPSPETLADQRLPDLLEDFDARQMLHVTFGSALAEFRPRLFELLRAHEEAYTETIARHFVHHLEPFARA